MPDLDFSLKHLQESGAQASPLQVDGCNSIWLLDDDASMLRALGRLVKAAGFSVERFNHPIAFLSRLKEAICQVAVIDVWDAKLGHYPRDASTAASPGASATLQRNHPYELLRRCRKRTAKNATFLTEFQFQASRAW